MTTEDNAALIPLPFTVVETSSASPGCEAAKLEQYDEDGDGWQSETECNFPQVLTLNLLNDKSAVIDVIEILCHETKIPTKVDIDLGIGESISNLGYIVFQSGDLESRELKSIPIGRDANFVRFTIHGSHEGPHNPNNQVGIAAIRVLSSQADVSAPIGEDIEVLNKKVQSAASNSLPLSIKNELDPKIAASVDRLERLKKESAAAEDFDVAARIKQELGQVYALLIAFKESENLMKQAALEEDYVEASRLKAERDQRRNAARAALTKVEQQFAVNVNADNVANLSISTIKDRSFVSERSFHDKEEEDGEHSFLSDEEESYSSGDGKENSSEDNSSPRSGDGTNDHPLAGVDGAEELPSPEDITLSTDLVHKVESLFGSYRAKCLFSKNWALREAALAKMTLMIPEICSTGLEGDNDISEIIFSIIESSMIQDKNVQVNLSSLILLDEALLQLETTRNVISITPQLTRILVDLFSKMADNSKKVADSAEISLLALAHSSSVDVSYVSMLATKRVRSKEAKGGRTIRARLQFLENLSAEFGVDVAWKKIIDFAKSSKAFDHRDGSVRDAAKSLVITLAMIHGNEVFKLLEGDLTERQLRELQLGLQMVQ